MPMPHSADRCVPLLRRSRAACRSRILPPAATCRVVDAPTMHQRQHVDLVRRRASASGTVAHALARRGRDCGPAPPACPAGRCSQQDRLRRRRAACAAAARRDCRRRRRNRPPPRPGCAPRSPPTASAGRRARWRRNRGRAARRRAPPPPAWREMPGDTTTSARRAPSGRPPVVEALEDQRRHGVDAGIAGGDQRDVAALAGERQRLAHPRPPPRRGRNRSAPPRRQRSRPDRDRANSRPRRRASPSRRRASGVSQSRAARPDADDRERPARAADRARVDDAGRLGDGAGRRARSCASARPGVPSGPAAASAAPSATPWQPTSRKTTSEGFCEPRRLAPPAPPR